MDSSPRQPALVDPVIVTTKTALKAAVAESFAAALKQSMQASDDAPPPESFGWITNKEAIKLLGLSKPTLARYRSKGTIPYSRFGVKVYYKLSDLEALLAERRVDSSAKSSTRQP